MVFARMRNIIRQQYGDKKAQGQFSDYFKLFLIAVRVLFPSMNYKIERTKMNNSQFAIKGDICKTVNIP